MNWECTFVGVSISLLCSCSILFSEADPRGRDSDDNFSVDARSPENNEFCEKRLDGEIGRFPIYNDGTVLTNSLDGVDGTFFNQGDLPDSPFVIESGVCGKALQLGGAAAAYAVLPTEAFSETRSIDFWFRPSLGNREENYWQGLLTRESTVSADGNIGLYLVLNNVGRYQLVVQRTIAAGTTEVTHSCSSADQNVKAGSWNHLVLSFSGDGTDTVFLNGQSLSGDSINVKSGETLPCVDPTTLSFGTFPPQTGYAWRWGASPDLSIENSRFRGFLDELRLRSVETDSSEALEIYQVGIRAIPEPGE